MIKKYTEFYTLESARTDLKSYEPVKERLIKEDMPELVHFIMGVSTESAELMDLLKKHLVYNQCFDRDKLIAEGGDCLWYLVQMFSLLGVSVEEVMQLNLKKLKKRYPEGFNESDAINNR